MRDTLENHVAYRGELLQVYWCRRRSMYLFLGHMWVSGMLGGCSGCDDSGVACRPTIDREPVKELEFRSPNTVMRGGFIIYGESPSMPDDLRIGGFVIKEGGK